jgi:hypothetical protein
VPRNPIYEQFSLQAAAAAIAKGHGDPVSLRELLVWTNSKTTRASVEAYFRLHHDDEDLLRALFAIAAEGEDAGDGPAAAANQIAQFPASMLAPYRAELVKLSKQQWDYLSKPAREALAKIER